MGFRCWWSASCPRLSFCSCHPFYGVGRLKEGVSAAAAEADLAPIAGHIAVQYPHFNRDNSVGQRTREIGVRMALGAQRASVYQLILREACWLAALGIVSGILCSFAATRLLRSMLFAVSPRDAGTAISVVCVLAASALLASFAPAHRAASIDPAKALRAE
jgi:predicted lysophospholipase L1 biosynthesis ABC-type transport system permease subunit